MACEISKLCVRVSASTKYKNRFQDAFESGVGLPYTVGVEESIAAQHIKIGFRD